MEENKQIEKSQAPLENSSSLVHLLAIFGIFTICITFFSLLTNMLLVNGFDIKDAFSQEVFSHGQLNGLLFAQIISSIGIFIVPAILFSFLKSTNPLQFLKVKPQVDIKMVFFTILLFFSVLPLIDGLVRLMHMIPFDEFDNATINTMIELEVKSEQLFSQFLDFQSVGGFVLAFFTMAIVPAVGEELFFRGVLQNIFMKSMKSPILAIVTTALIFTFFHSPLYNLPALLFMGILLGLIYHWTKNIWYSIAAHLFNNGMIVVFAGLGKLGWIDFDFQTQDSLPWYFAIIGLCIFVPLLFFYKKQAIQIEEA